MRRVYLTLAGCMVALLMGMGLLSFYDRTETDLVLPGADDVQIDGLALARWQRITYPLRPNQTLNDVYKRLEYYGWSRDQPAEQRLLRDQINHNGSLAAFTRQHLFDIFSEIALVRRSQTDQRSVEIEIFRCFRLRSLTGCL